MSRMIVFNYDDGEKTAVASWSAEYGWLMAGDREILNRISVEEKESRVPDTLFPATPPPATPVVPEPGLIDPVGPCFSCGCSKEAHDDEDGCARHSCRTYVP